VKLDDLKGMLAELAPGDEVKLEIVREGKNEEITLELGKR